MAGSELQSKDLRDLLNTVDKLRAQGLSRYVDLPQIVVCGDQSSGKSSVLEAISGMSFPSDDGLCTRFATELILRHDVSTNLKVSIIPGPTRTEGERVQLTGFSYETHKDQIDLATVTAKAKTAMGLDNTNGFSQDTLRVELSGPTQPHLTLVDLPGIFRSSGAGQSKEHAPMVRQLVESWMQKSRTVIVCVVSAKNDFALQDITELARKADPQSSRTLGLITKPDCVIKGTSSEVSYIKMAKNSDVVLKLGWHTLRNRAWEERNSSADERDATESEFFRSGRWAELDPQHRGIQSLKSRLSTILGERILNQLPELLQEVNHGIVTTKTNLERLGAQRSSNVQQRLYLIQLAQKFTTLVAAAVEGAYHDPFFGDPLSPEGYSRRFRAVIQNLLVDYEKKMRTEGKSRVLLDPTDPGQQSSPHIKNAHANYLKEVQEMMRRTKGAELCGTFNPSILRELFRQQCKKWPDLTKTTGEKIVNAASTTMTQIIRALAVKETTQGILRYINAQLETIKRDMNLKTEEIMRPHLEGHPISYNHYLTETVQTIQAGRNRSMLEQVLRDHQKHQGPLSELKGSILAAFTKKSEPEMKKHACITAIDYSEAYYKVAFKRVIDDFGVLAIEQCLVQKLATLFTPEIVSMLSDDQVRDMAAEQVPVTQQRSRLVEQLGILEAGLEELKRLDSCRVPTDCEDISFLGHASRQQTLPTHNPFMEPIAVRLPSVGKSSFGHYDYSRRQTMDTTTIALPLFGGFAPRDQPPLFDSDEKSSDSSATQQSNADQSGTKRSHYAFEQT